MGVIKRFAVSSIVLGVLALAGGASAFAFNGSSDESPAAPAQEQTTSASEVHSDVPSDVPGLPETGGPAAASRWFAPHGR
jgi:hypothetical protein